MGPSGISEHAALFSMIMNRAQKVRPQAIKNGQATLKTRAESLRFPMCYKDPHFLKCYHRECALKNMMSIFNFYLVCVYVWATVCM